MKKISFSFDHWAHSALPQYRMPFHLGNLDVFLKKIYLTVPTGLESNIGVLSFTTRTIHLLLFLAYYKGASVDDFKKI